MATLSEIRIPMRNTCPSCGFEDEYFIDIDSDLSHLFDTHKTSMICSRCGKTRQDAEEEKRKALADEATRRMLADAGIPQEFAYYDKAQGNRALCERIFTERDRSMYISGSRGVGKTRAVCNILQWCIKHGERGKFWRFSDFADEYAGARRGSSAEAKDWLCGELSNAVFVLDDIDKRKLTPAAGDLLYDIFDRVYSRQCRARIWVTASTSPGVLIRYFEDKNAGDGVIARIDRMIEAARMVRVDA